MRDRKAKSWEMTPVRKGWWPLARAALDAAHAGPIMAATFLVSVVAALCLTAVTPLLIGVALTATAVAVQMSSRGFWTELVETEAARAVTLPSENELSHGAAKAFLSRLVSFRAQLDSVLERRPSAPRGDCLVRIQRVRGLERAAVASLLRLDYMSHGPVAPRSSGGSAASDVRGAPAEHPLLERVLGAREDQLGALAALEACRREEMSRLEYLTSCLEGIPAAMMELDVLERLARERVLPDPVREADTLRDEIRNVRQEMGRLRA